MKVKITRLACGDGCTTLLHQVSYPRAGTGAVFWAVGCLGVAPSSDFVIS